MHDVSLKIGDEPPKIKVHILTLNPFMNYILNYTNHNKVGTYLKKQGQPTNPYAVTLNAFVKQMISTVLCILPLSPYPCRLWNVEWGEVQSVECKDSGALSGECSV